MEKKRKWEGKVVTTVKKASADQIWALFTDFFNLHRWFPKLATCHGVSGSNGLPGCVRFCSGSSIPSSQGVSWSLERLLAVDHASRCLTYDLLDSNIGFQGYVSTVRIVPGEAGGCQIEWGFSVDPVDGWTQDSLLNMYDAALHLMAHQMEDYVAAMEDH